MSTLKNVIVTVGASVISQSKVGFTNVVLSNPDELDKYRDKLREKLEELESKFQEMGGDLQALTKLSAEANTLQKLKEYFNANLRIILITTSTLDGAIAAEFLREKLRNLGVVEKVESLEGASYVIVKGLQVNDDKLFRREGLPNLFRALDEAHRLMGEAIICASGGYKAMLYYVVLFGIIKRLPVYYIYERSEGLLRIPPLPLQLSEEVIKDYVVPLVELDRAEKPEDIREWRRRYEKLLKSDEVFRNLIEEEDDIVLVNPIAKLLLEELTRGRLVPVAVRKGLLEDVKELHRLLTKFNRKTEAKNGHLVLDDGNNPYRLIFFERKRQILAYEVDVPHIYAVFKNHDKYERFLNKRKAEEFMDDEYELFLYDKKQGELLKV